MTYCALSAAYVTCRNVERLRVAIAGMGITGAYLFRLLKKEGINPEIYEVKHSTACGIHSCGWGTSLGFAELTKAVNLDPETYITERFDNITFDGIRLRAEFYTFDKPRFIKDLVESADVKYTPLNMSSFDRVIDATGVARAYLPPIKSDLLMNCVEYRVKASALNHIEVKIGGGGYAWHFPLGNSVHIGYGSFTEDPIGKVYGKTLSGWDIANPICGCRSVLRASAPEASRPFVLNGSPQVIGVGEAIGCVSPLVGDGIVHGMRSVRLLLDCWDDPEAYTEKILREFEWLDEERKVVDKMVHSEKLNILDALVLLRNSRRRMGIKMSILDVLRMSRSFS